ncbi:MAG: Disulfide bond formation protein B [Alphaproteobacteria bacterium MarineAlpha3_Bin5]|nr:hypothetical protein [Magnetovibrio sp.]PPR77696.1 MAG: Disulfide bond formation protein B [Alphaproteobacteria bacterium MarineAlpha3_Bin5]
MTSHTSNSAQKLIIQFHIMAFSIGIGALGLAFGTELFLGVIPCELCIYQRIPYIIIAICGVVGFFSRSYNIKHLCIAITALAFLSGSSLAFYHMGIERQWWSSTELCGEKLVDVSKTESLIQALSKRQNPGCSDVNVSFLGLSMVTYNLFFSLPLTVIVAWFWRKVGVEKK